MGNGSGARMIGALVAVALLGPLSACSTRVSSPSTVKRPTTEAASLSRQSTGYFRARTEWVEGAKAADAEHAAYFARAAADLQVGLSGDQMATSVSGRSAYVDAIRQLIDLASLPDADETPVQQEESRSDTVAIDSFFHTPGLYF